MSYGKKYFLIPTSSIYLKVNLKNDWSLSNFVASTINNSLQVNAQI